MDITTLKKVSIASIGKEHKMSKYYKKLPKESFRFYGKSVSYPDHKTSSNGWPRHTSKRRVKKFIKYDWYNEWLFQLLFGKVENYKRIPINTHWKNLEDARKETSESWLYTIDDEETFESETTEWKQTMKPRWRAFMSARLSESK